MSEYIVELTPKLYTDLRSRRGEEIVRCKDCRKHNNIHGQDWCKESARYVEPGCFCSWAERREQ